MQNVNPEVQLKKCIFKPLDEFERDLRHLPKKLRVEVSYEGLDFYAEDEKDEENIDILTLLSSYYEVNVTSIHADDWEDMGIWICYKEK